MWFGLFERVVVDVEVVKLTHRQICAVGCVRRTDAENSWHSGEQHHCIQRVHPDNDIGHPMLKFESSG